MSDPTVLSIAGSDSGGGAGIQADLKAIAATGVHGATAITSVTSQNTQGVTRVDPLPIEGLTAQIEAVVEDLDVRAVKTGMLHTPEVVETVAEALADRDLPVVVDPVMVATSGDALSEGRLPEALSKLAEVTTLVTPNIDEVEMLLDTDVATLDDARQAGRALREDGWTNVLVKGGHLDTDDAVDLLLTPDATHTFTYPRLPGPFHGAGCTYSSLIAGLLARGHGLVEAVTEARARMQRALERAYAPGEGPRVLDALEANEPGPAEGAPLSVAAWRLAATLPLQLVPEVGINMAYAPDDATEPSRVLALARRITRGAEAPTAPGPVTEGASSHVARVLLAARHVRPEISTAMNLAYSQEILAAAERAGLTFARFDREEEPPEADATMEWGTTSALKTADDDAVDLVVDDGGVGKEAMVRVIARSPADLLDTAEGLAEELTR